MAIRKPNIILLVIGLFAVSMFAMSFYFSWTDRNVRLNGNLKKVRIVNISYGKRSTRSAIVEIDNIRINSGQITANYSIGDSILVRYIPNEYCVVQERIHPNRYYLYFTLESILLLAAIALIVESLKGKDFSYYQNTAIDFKNLVDNILKWISKKLRL